MHTCGVQILRLFALFQRFACSSLLGTPLDRTAFILFSDCQSPAAARWCKRSQVTPTPTHRYSPPRAPHKRAKWGVDVDGEEGIWMGAFQRADGQMRVCMGANVTNTRWVGAIGQAPRGSVLLLIMRDRSRDPIVYKLVRICNGMARIGRFQFTQYSPLLLFPSSASLPSL